jgi:hypothetical protein
MGGPFGYSVLLTGLMSIPHGVVQTITPLGTTIAQKERNMSNVTALDVLKSLSIKKDASPAAQVAPVSVDPAIAGAKREKTIVKLGVDSQITDSVTQAVRLKALLDKHQEEFTVHQETLREYGKDKRDLYNDTFKAEVATVAIPYEESGETRYVQVVCSNRYSVAKNIILNNQQELGSWFPQLFTVETTKKLKGDSENLIRNLLGELGLAGTELDTAMDSLFETEQKVSTVPGYETISKTVPAPVKSILDQAVTRASPALKF